ncbi:MAG: glycosyltransferase family 2 protein [Bacteroidota bacterium]
MATLTVVTLALNEERNIRDCLASVRWADQILVVDSGSTDRTREIAAGFTDHVLRLEWKGFGGTKNEALAHACGDWILWMDADERVTPELEAEIRRILEEDPPDICAYDVARRSHFLGRWMRHGGWYPSRVVRLFRRGRGRFTEARVHEGLEVEGGKGSLRSDLLHYTDPDLHHYFRKFNRYTTLAAEELGAGGRRFSLRDLLLRPPFQFVKMYLLRRGFLDGIQGFVLAACSAAYVFVKYAKLWEREHPRKENS